MCSDFAVPHSGHVMMDRSIMAWFVGAQQKPSPPDRGTGFPVLTPKHFQ
jgi:hypothetical protein